MTPQEREALIGRLRERFEANMHRHREMAWSAVEAALGRNPGALRALQAMDASGGEPDVLGEDQPGHVTFYDCSAESPAGRRSLCYDGAARNARKEHKPRGSALELAVEMGVELLTEEQYRQLQMTGEFDIRTSSWIRTPPDVRSLGGALFCDRRYGRVFVYHNGAQSYYAGRGFRGRLRV
jgi:hypothetical protein